MLLSLHFSQLKLRSHKYDQIMTTSGRDTQPMQQLGPSSTCRFLVVRLQEPLIMDFGSESDAASPKEVLTKKPRKPLADVKDQPAQRAKIVAGGKRDPPLKPRAAKQAPANPAAEKPRARQRKGAAAAIDKENQDPEGEPKAKKDRAKKPVPIQKKGGKGPEKSPKALPATVESDADDESEGISRHGIATAKKGRRRAKGTLLSATHSEGNAAGSGQAPKAKMSGSCSEPESPKAERRSKGSGQREQRPASDDWKGVNAENCGEAVPTVKVGGGKKVAEDRQETDPFEMSALLTDEEEISPEWKPSTKKVSQPPLPHPTAHHPQAYTCTKSKPYPPPPARSPTLLT
jgi:hypothetical protein